MASVDPHIMIMLNMAQQEVRNAETAVEGQKHNYKQSEKALAKAGKEVTKAQRAVKRTKREAIKYRGATYIDPRGNIVQRTFTAAPEEGVPPTQEAEQELTYDPEVAIATAKLEQQQSTYKRGQKAAKRAAREVEKARARKQKACGRTTT